MTEEATGTAANAPAAAAGGSGLAGFMISGAKTGEEKYFSAVDVRRPVDENHSADAQARRLNRTTATAVTDADRIRKLEQELRKSQEQVRKRTAEMEAQSAKHKQSLAELKEKSDNQRLEALELQKQQHDAAAKALIGQVDQLSGQVSRLSEDRRKRHAEDTEASRRREGEFNASATMWSSERDMLQKELDKLRKQLADEKARSAQLSADVKTANFNMETARAEWAKLEQQLRTELAAALKEIRELKGTLEEQRENVDAWQKRVMACNEFILQICQPKFSVVKDDEKLTPMSQAEAAAAAGAPGGASGFVLVPLTLMLNAYELLPKDAKQTIATKYENEKKTRNL